MKTKVFLSLIAMLMCVGITYAQQRIIGGTTANISERPYQVAVFVNGSLNGGGVLISNKWVLTAAHVVDGHSTSQIQICSGQTNVSNAGRNSVKTIIKHGSYPADPFADLALLELQAPLILSSTRKAIAISATKTYAKGTVATVSGWGRRSVGGAPSSTQLYKTNVTIQACNGNKIEAEISNNMPYKGDSGGPLTISTSTGDLLIGIIKGGVNESNPTTGISTYVNAGVYLDWILEKVPDLYANAISGPSLLCSTGTYTVSPYPQNAQISLSPNLKLLSQSGGTLNIQATSRGRAYISMKIGSNTVAQKNFWAKEPAITGVTYDGSYLRVETAGADAQITQTEWIIGTDLPRTSYEDYLWCPYTSGTYNITVTSTNSCGTGLPYHGQITLARSSRYAISVLARQITVSPVRDEDNTGNLQLLEAPASPTMNYTLVNLNSGIIATNGSMSSEGGTLDFSTVPAGLYVLKLFTPDGAEETFKVQLK